MKKWAYVVALVLLAAAGTAAWWVPWIAGLAVQKKETIESLKNLVELVSGAAGGLVAIVNFLLDRREEKSRAGQALRAERSSIGRDAISAGGNVQTGGVSAQEDAAIGGDVVSGNKTVIYQSPATPAPSAPVLNALHSLPPPPADFTGRAEDLTELRAAILVGGVSISGLQGQGGVGKTALALKLAADLTPNFPDAQIYMDLRGVSDKPLTSAEAMAYVVRAFQPEAKAPESENELSALYRSHFARQEGPPSHG
jgi:hypothetical protein